MILVGEERNVRAPEGLHKAIAAYGGRNPHGDPTYRLVWGWERTELRASPTTLVEDKSIANRRFMAGRNVALQSLPKYSPRERFHLEVWCPPEMYGTPEDWGRQFRKTIAGEAIDTLGPFPSAGEYEHLWECSDEDGGYLHPTVNLVFRAIRQHKRAAEMDRAKRRQDRDDFEAQKEKAETTARRDATRQLAKEFVEKALPGRTVQELKSELTAPKERKRWRSR